MAAQENNTPEDDNRLSLEILLVLDSRGEIEHFLIARLIGAAPHRTEVILGTLEGRGHVQTRREQRSTMKRLLGGGRGVLVAITPAGRSEPEFLELLKSIRKKIIQRHHDSGRQIPVYNHLRYLRCRRGLSRTGLADEVGINPRTVARVEAHEPPAPDLATAFRLCRALDAPFEETFQPGEGL